MSPFKFKRQDSLKVFFINFSDIEGRLDPLYYYSVNNLSIVNHTRYPVKKLSEVIAMQRGRFGHRPRNEPRFYGGEYPFIQTGDIVRASKSNGHITFSQTLNKLGLKTSRLFSEPVVVITIAANIGDTAILDYPACFPDSLIGLTPKTNELTLEYINLYFKFIKTYLEDLAPQSAQKNINYQQLSPVPIVIPPLEVQQRAVQLYHAALIKRQGKEQQAQALLAGIDAYLLVELGIDLPTQNNSLDERIFKSTFKQVISNRLDAGFHHKFNFLFSKAGKYKYELLKNLLTQPPQYGANEEACEAKSKDDVRYIRITDIDEYGNLKQKEWKSAVNVADKYRMHVDDILFARSGSVGRCYIHKETNQEAIFAGYLIKFQLDKTKINPDYLFYYCHSAIYKFWVSAIQRPSVQANINAEEYKALLIPLPSIDKQNEIADYIANIRNQSKQLQTEAAQILTNAKAEVERMILGE